METARKGITVKAVAPGWTETEMVSAVPRQVYDGTVATIPLQRMGRPDEVARVVAFLAEEASGYITGAIYNVNGGLDM